MRVTVIVPTYRRPNDLKRCLEGLNKQLLAPSEILIIVRVSDTETCDFLDGVGEQTPQIKIIEVAEPGQVAALNAGLEATTGEIIAITDDDTIPRADWIARIEAHFRADSRLGGWGDATWYTRQMAFLKASVRWWEKYSGLGDWWAIII